MAIIALAGLTAFGQDIVFSDPAVDYSFAVPEATWKLTVRPSATNPNVEYVYGDRRDGYLTVRKISVQKNALLTDVIDDEGHNKLQLSRPGYIAGKEENFAGKLRGSVFNFEYVASGTSMGGRYYFLRANDTTVYILQFTGSKERLRGIRNQTDMIARTFGVK
jgi:hypothetical protein